MKSNFSRHKIRAYEPHQNVKSFKICHLFWATICALMRPLKVIGHSVREAQDPRPYMVRLAFFWPFCPLNLNLFSMVNSRYLKRLQPKFGHNCSISSREKQLFVMNFLGLFFYPTLCNAIKNVCLQTHQIVLQIF